MDNLAAAKDMGHEGTDEVVTTPAPLFGEDKLDWGVELFCSPG